MSTTVERLKAEMLLLTPAERADLAYFLLTTLEPQEEGVKETWQTEIARQVTEIRSRQAQGRPVDEVLADLRHRYRRTGSW